MSSTSHLAEVDLLRRQVADLARELTERDRVLHEQTRHLHVVQALAHLGSWNWDMSSGEVQWSDELYRIFGYEPRSREATVDTFVSAVLPDDHDRVSASINDALAGTDAYELECRIVRPNGEVRTVHCCGEVVRDESGQPLRMSGTALDITDRKQTESSLQRESYLRALIEHSSDVITVLDLDGTILFESPSIERLLGYAQQELHGRIAFEFVHRDDLLSVTEKFQLLIQRPGTPQLAEFRFLHKNGSWRHFEGIGRAICDSEGRRRVIINSRDITERNRTEVMLQTSQEKLRQALQASGIGLWDWNTETNEVVLSKEWKRQLGYEETELSDLFETWETRLHPEDHAGAIAYVRAYLAKPEGDYRQEFRLRHEDGTYRWIEARASFVEEADGRRIRLLGSHTDITDRKRMEEVVRESEERYRTLVELSPSGVFVFSEGRTVYVNHTGAVLLGANDPQEILERPTFEFIHPDYHHDVRENVKRLLVGGVSVHSAERVYLKMDGTPIPVQVEAARITWNGQPAIFGLFSDITERKLAEQTLRESEERYRALYDETPSMYFTVDGAGIIRSVNQYGAQYLGYRVEELVGKPVATVFFEEDRARVCAEMETFFRCSEEVTQWEFRKVRGDGTVRWVREIARLLQSRDGESLALIVCDDITERKRAEEALASLNTALERLVDDRTDALRRSEERFRQFFDNAPNATCLKDQNSRYVYTNRRFDEIFGLASGMALGKTDEELFSPEQAAQFQSRDRDVLVGGHAQEFEQVTQQPDGPHTSIVVKFPVADASGRLSAIGAIATDITERKRTQEALRESEARWQQFAESVGSAFWIADISGDEREVLYVNSAFTFIWGIEREEIYRNWSLWLESIHPEDRMRVKANHDRFVRGGQTAVFHCEYRIVGRDGHIRWISDRRVRMAGWENRVACIAEDITHHKQQLTLMAQTEAIGKIGGWQLDFLTDRLWWSDEMYRLHETTPESYSPSVETALSFYMPDSRPRMTEALEKGMGQGAPWDLELELITAKGRRIAVRTVGKVDVVNERAVRAYGTFQDITERKRAEEALRRAHDELERKVMERTAELQASQERYARATAIGKVGVWELDVVKGRYHGDTNLKSLFGYGDQELSTDPFVWLKLVYPDDQSIAMRNWEQVQSGAADACHYELRMVKKDGSIVWTDVRCHSVRGQDGRLTHLIGATVDITERKQAEQALKESEERFSKAFRTSPHPIGITEVTTGRCIEVNDACLDLFGFRREEVIGHTTLMLGIWPNLEDRERVIARLKARQPVRNMEFALRIKSGAVRHFLASADLAELNGTLCVVTVANDITDRKQAEEALRMSEERFAKAFQASPHPVVITELDSGRVVDINDAASQMFGYRKEEVVGQTALQVGLWHSLEERARFRELLKNEGSVRNLEVALRSRSGEVRRCLLSSELIELNGKQCSVTVGDDVTESKRMERALRLTQFSVDQAVEAILWVDPTGRIFNVNDTACRMLGYVREDLTAMTVHDIDPNFPVERWKEHWSFLKEQGALAFEAKYWSQIGEVLETEVTFNYLQYDGKEYGCAILRDIGERKRAEATLRRSEERFRSIFENAGIGIAFTDAKGRYIQCNPAYCAIVGYSEEELSHATFQQLIHPKDYAQNRDLVEQLANYSIPSFEVENRYVHKDGHIVQVHKFITALRGDDGRLTHFIALVTDVSERKRAEAELRHSHMFLRQVIDTDPNFIFAKDRAGRFAMVNRAMADCYGTTVEDLIGKSDADFNSNEEEVEFFRRKDLEVMDSLEERFIPEEKITDSTGKTRWLQTVKRPILDDYGRAQMVLGAATDITERKRMEEMLIQRERDLHAALQERERISQDLHDGILQSLYAVGLGLEACKPMIRQQPERVSVKFMATLDQAIGQLNHVMGEVRNFIAGLESHVIQGGDFPTALRNMIRAMSSSSSAKCTVRIDKMAVRQLSTEQALHIINIVREGLSNALRHSGANHITVSLRSLIHSVRLAITDDGIGFNASSTQGVGHGLGNMAARAQKVRGVFALRSKPHTGTRISLDLPKDKPYAHN